jgi:hypothetical protein
MIANKPEILFGHRVRGFVEWYNEHCEYLKTLFTKEAEDIFGSLEDFAVELFLTIKCGLLPDEPIVSPTVEPQPVI